MTMELRPCRRPPAFSNSLLCRTRGTSAVRLAMSTWAVVIFAMGVGSGFSLGQEPTANRPLYQLIDQLCTPSDPALVAPIVEDGLFLRRLSLDLRNTVPTTDELKLFLADPDPDKRGKWIDRFLDDPLFAERIVTWLDLTLMERRTAQNVNRQAWIDFLRSKVDTSTPIDQLTREMVTSPWWSKEGRAEQRFFLDRGGDPHLITRDFGRIFLGRDLQCAQCHDHPIVDDYLQRDYHGLLAFYSPSSLVEVSYKDAEGKDAKLQVYAEKASADASFESVFVKGKPHWAGPMLPDRSVSMEKLLAPSDRYQGTAIDWAVGDPPKKPSQSRRSLLASELLAANYQPFSENWANRIWAILFGEGLVQPLDMHHANNPASHPALLKALAEELVRSKYDYRSLIRDIAKSQTYQRSHWLPLESGQANPTSISKEHLLTQVSQAKSNQEHLIEQSELAETKWKEALQAYEATETEHVRLRSELTKLDASWLDASKKTSELAAAHAAANKVLHDARQKQTLLTEALQKLEQAKSLTTGEDAELSQSIQLTKQRSDAHQAVLPNLETAFVAATTNLEAQKVAEKSIADQTLAINTAIDSLQPTLATHHSAISAARDQWRSLELQRTELDRKLGELDRLVQWRELQDAIELASSQKTVLEKQLVERQQNVAMHRAKLDESQRILDGLTSTAQSKSTAVEAAKGILDAKRAELAKIAESKKQLEESLALVSNPQSIRPAIDELAQSILARNSLMGQLQADIDAAMQALAVASLERDQHQAAHSQLQLTVQQADQAIVGTTTSLAELQRTTDDAWAKSQSRWQQVVEDRSRQLDAARLRPLSAEQFCWSILRVTGIFDQWVASQMAELDKAQPLPADMPVDEQVKKNRYRLAMRKAIDVLRGNADQFANLFAAGAGQVDSFFASAEQALFLANGGSVHSWAGPSGNNVTVRVAQNADRDAAIDDLYETLLCRKPTAAERELVKSHLNVAPELAMARSHEAVWAILTSVEFRFVQ